MKTPITMALDAQKLRKAGGKKSVYFYEGVTVDPRYVDVELSPSALETAT